MQATIKTTMNFSLAFHRKLKRAADVAGKPMSQLVEEKLAPILNVEEKTRLDRVYGGLGELEGIVKADAPDASAAIDDYLYDWDTEPKEVREPNP